MFTKLMNQLGKLPTWLEALVVCILLSLAALWVLLAASSIIVALVTTGVIFYWLVYSIIKDMKGRY